MKRGREDEALLARESGENGHGRVELSGEQAILKNEKRVTKAARARTAGSKKVEPRLELFGKKRRRGVAVEDRLPRQGIHGIPVFKQSGLQNDLSRGQRPEALQQNVRRVVRVAAKVTRERAAVDL